MAKKKQVTVAAETRELEKTLVVDNITYNINAVHSDNTDLATSAVTADKVCEKLTINSHLVDNSGSSKIETLDFDGSNAKSIDVVPAAGGKFSGPIQAGNHTVSSNEFSANAILNYSDIKNVLVSKLLNSSILYSWDPSKSSNKFTPVIKTGAISGIGIVFGKESALNGTGGFAVNNSTNFSEKLPVYLYICSDSYNIYFGTSDSSTASMLANSATELRYKYNSATEQSYSANDIFADIKDLKDKLANLMSSSGKVSKATSAEQLVFTDGSGSSALTAKNIQDLISSIQTNIANIINGSTATGKATNAVNLVSATKTYTADDIAALADSVSSNTGNITKIVNGTTVVAKATAADSASAASKATQDANGNTISTYYQKKIIISQDSPSGGANGDIWIKY